VEPFYVSIVHNLRFRFFKYWRTPENIIRGISMKLTRGAFIAFFILILFMLTGFLPAQEKDMEGSRDHPLLPRMQNYYIRGYEESDHGSSEFYDAEDNEYVIEGHKWVISYTLIEGFLAPDQSKVRQNYINAIRKMGGTVLDELGEYFKVAKGDKETWIYVWVSPEGKDYELTIVERPASKQEIAVDFNAMVSDLKATGHVVVYDIDFDHDSFNLKPESEPMLKAIAEMLKANSSLNVYVVSHTDMTGELEYNMQLSEKRAEAVVKALVNEYGIEASRLKAKGVGPLCPVITNQTGEGRKLNRRIELVEML
jgi:outer membrane protein OmpA-like peptidoglycan-associated protein